MKKLLLLLIFACNLHAETIEFIVPGSAGGSDDMTTRTLVSELEAASDLRFIVVNKPGVAHNIGYAYMKTTNKPSVIIATDAIIKNKINSKEGYPDGVVDVIDPIFFLGDFSNIIFVSAKLNVKTIDDLIQLSKERDIRFGHGGVGTYSHDALLKICGDIMKCLPVPYKSGVNSLMDLMNNTIDAYAYVSNGVDVYIENRALRPVMMFSNNKHTSFDVPLLPKKIKKLEIKNWLMLFGKNLTDKQIETIISLLKKKSPKFYTDMGLWYEYKDAKTIWRNDVQ